jgi:hypothetical protein
MNAVHKIGDENCPVKPGRPKGARNRITGLLKEAILKAAEAEGDRDNGNTEGLTGYCRFLARSEPKAFAQLLGKVLPLQVTGDDDGDGTLTFRVIYETH